MLFKKSPIKMLLLISVGLFFSSCAAFDKNRDEVPRKGKDSSLYEKNYLPWENHSKVSQERGIQF
jgi:hypothetical protein